MGWIERGWAMASLAIDNVRAGAAHRLRRLRAKGGAQSTVEYALVGALVVIAAAGALTLLGGEVSNVFSRITNTLAGAASAGR